MSDLAKRLATLSPEKRKVLLRQLQKNQAVESPKQTILPRQQEGNIFPLSSAQQRFWFLDLLEPESAAAYLIPGVLRFQGSIDIESLQKSLQALVQRHEILRTTFSEQDGQPV